MIIIFIWMFLALFGFTQSVIYDCKFNNADWGVQGTIYWCDVQTIANITSVDDAQIDNITGTHLAGFSNVNVTAFQLMVKGQLHYFPRGLNTFFKNLKGIYFASMGLRELHQSDLKDFPKLTQLWLFGNNIEVLEEDLFEYNPNIEWISLLSNKISHIDPKVFVNLIKLKTLYLSSNTCINMFTINNQTEVQNIIKTAQTSCTNLDYSSLEQKVKYLEKESNLLDSIDLNVEVESLEIEIQNSKFSNFFQEQIAGLYAVAFEKEREDVQDTKISNIEEMVANINNGNGTGKNTIILNIL